ncbi:MAG TPA: hypothetical protein VMK65_05480, partial [Longimicrobiales bacterium]|nr:hypothetical protein [Longimicrobiales bacterium]
KLYHPAHQRYYLVTSSLVCRTVGLPDRKVNPGKDERPSFVMRRLLPPSAPDAGAAASPPDLASWEEHAFLATADGYAWEKVGSAADGTAARILPDEERTRLFGAGFTGEEGRERRMFAGVVPVGAREAYLGAPLREGADGGEGAAGGDASAPAAAAPPDPRLTLFRIQVLEPWRALIAQASVAAGQAAASASHPEFGVPGNIPAAKANALDLVREQIQTGSWYILLDLADFLKSELPGTWQQVKAPPATAPVVGTLLHALNLPVPLAPPLTPLALFTGFLSRTDRYTAGHIKATLADALRAVTADGVATRLERVTTPYDRQAPHADWPSFLFPLADPEQESSISFSGLRGKLKQLEDLIEKELAASPKDLPQPATALMTESALDLRDGWFVIRCVFERPNCGQLKPPVVSAPTEPFQLAAFFDPDAPARPIRISLPADTTPAGLRKFAKNTVFQFSDILCGQVDALKKITFGDLVLSVLPWPFHKDLDLKDVGVCKGSGDAPAGMACSLSIPIVTICALILLIMIVAILDYIFRWIPWFIACFRIPGLSGKNA